MKVLFIHCRNVDSEARITFSKIFAIFSQPEFKILRWLEEDLARYGEKARTIGAPLAEGETLFTELQNTYCTCKP